MCYQNDGALPSKTLDGLRDLALGESIECARRLVQDQQRCAPVQCPGDSDALTLTAAQAYAPLTHYLQVSVRQRTHEFIEPRVPQRVA